ncbi:chitin-binding domain-containing protein [Streptomyces sp. NPDC004520]|uniref:chitin-binding domain-containing protein n=1 Tax=Streptomyces sp. NPDC004520 TaxID=3364702 RepID=UPI0036A01E53
MRQYFQCVRPGDQAGDCSARLFFQNAAQVCGFRSEGWRRQCPARKDRIHRDHPLRGEDRHP